MVDVPINDEDQGITAYHGSPHEFDQFDLSKIGTGEGAQAYGHGLYFAEAEPVAQEYRDRLSDRTSSFQIENVDIPKWVINKISQNPDQSAAINDLRRDFAQRLSEAQEEQKTSHQPWLVSGRISSAKDILAGLDKIEQGARLPSTKGHMYEVRINAHPDHFLDWDKPLVEQPHIMQAIDQHIGDPEIVFDQLFGHREATGRDLHERFGGEHKPSAVAQRLSQMGIKGIKYLDASSRSSTDAPTRNYVVFDDKHVSVRRKYEQGGAVEGMVTGGTVEKKQHPALSIPYGYPEREENLRAFAHKSHPQTKHENDMPRTFYHGTRASEDFSEFSDENAPYRGGIKAFVSESPEFASGYAGYDEDVARSEPDGRVYPVHIKTENPFDFRKHAYKANDFWEETGGIQDPDDIDRMDIGGSGSPKQKFYELVKKGSWDALETPEFVEWLRHNEGHDSVVIMEGGAINYGLFEPTQIKSATGNQGTFDPSNPDITKATGGEVEDETPYHQTPEFQNWFGGSVAHTDGVPTTYYHGTSKDKDYTSFNIGKHGLWLTADPAEASSYAAENDSQNYKYEGGQYVKTNQAARVLPVHIKAENPYRGDKPEELFQKQNYKKAQSDWFEQLRSQGYDSWIPDSQKGSLAVALKEPTQIKSIYNRSFDPKNKRMDKAAGGEADQASDIPQIDNAVSVFPKPQRMFPEDAPVPGGMYLNAATKEDMTGHKAAMASIGVQPGGKPYFRASPDSVDETGTPGRGSAMAKTNLFKQKAGWKWAQAPEGHEATDTIVSVQHRGQHHYTLNAHFPKGVDLARYEKSPTEPRLRPTTQGNITLGPQVGSILVRGKEHPVYEHVIVKSTGGEVSGKKTAGGSAVATMRRMSDPTVNEAIRVINRSGSSPRDAVTLSKRLRGRPDNSGV